MCVCVYFQELNELFVLFEDALPSEVPSIQNLSVVSY